MRRITIADLERQVKHLNELTNNPTEYTNKDTGKANVGHYTLSGAYGGYELQQIMNEGGGVNCPLYTGHISKRELSEKIYVYSCGVNLGKEIK